ncbi:MAG: zinc ribbon domain-containing protein [Acidobacteria bacterium]|nr:zinc ribbon domain-containing protein [Acidobacteriota bacterium]MBV9625609.1 zinc ribbon domain-containing protein [Acidobacteriota bacterium]
MPIFEYVCNQCHRRFEALVFGKDKPSCPNCQGKDLAMQLSVFSVPAKAQSTSESVGACGSCGDPRGPGSCSLPDLD